MNTLITVQQLFVHYFNDLLCITCTGISFPSVNDNDTPMDLTYHPSVESFLQGNLFFCSVMYLVDFLCKCCSCLFHWMLVFYYIPVLHKSDWC